MVLPHVYATRMESVEVVGSLIESRGRCGAAGGTY